MDEETIQNNVIAQRLYDAVSIGDKFSILEEEIKDVSGFDGVIYTFIPKLSRLTCLLQPVFQFSESISESIKLYQENNYSKHDYTMRLIENGNTDIIDWFEDAKRLSLSKQERYVNQAMKEKLGITKGYSFPTLGNDLGASGVAIISFKEEYNTRKLDSALLAQIHHCTRIYHDHITVHQDARYQFILPVLKTLTSKKKIVIKHLITGQPMKTITDAGVTERYANNLLSDLRETFGGISKNELIYLLGLLNISEYL